MSCRPFVYYRGLRRPLHRQSLISPPPLARFARYFFLLLLLAAAPLFAAEERGPVFSIRAAAETLEPAERPPSGMVAPLLVEVRLDPPGLLTAEEQGRLPLPLRRPLRPGEIRRAIAEIFATGKVVDVLARIEPAPGGVALHLTLIPRLRIESFSLSGARRIRKGEVQKAAGLSEGDELVPHSLNRAIEGVRALYRREGFFLAEVAAMAEHPSPTAVSLSLSIKEGEQARVRAVRFTGNPIFRPTRLHFAFLLQEPGEKYRVDLLEQGIQRLERFYLKEGYPKARVGPPKVNFVPEQNEVDIEIPIEAKEKVSIVFAGIGPIREGRLLPLVKIAEERSDEQAVLDDSAAAIAEYYHDHRFLFAEVSADKEIFREQNAETVRFRIIPGPEVRLKEIRFEGSSFPARRLKKMMTIRKEGLLLPERFSRRKLLEDLGNLTAFYRTEGFLDAELKEKLVFSPDRTRLTVVIAVEEGVRAIVSEVRVVGASVLPEEELLGLARLRPGEPFNEGHTREDRLRIINRYSRSGYIYSDVQIEPTFSKDRSEARVVYRVTEGEVVRVGRIDLSGNVRTKDRVIMREVSIHPGDPFNFDKVLKSQQRLFRLGYFSEVHFDPRLTGTPQIQGMEIRVRERPTMTMALSIGYADFEQLRGSVEVAERNLGGTGRQISARAEASRIEKKGSLNFVQPWLYPRWTPGQVLPEFSRIDARAGLLYIEKQERSFERRSLIANFGADKSFSDTVKGSLLYEYQMNNISNVEPVAVLTKEDVGRVRIGSLNPSIVRDTRDDPFNPAAGTLHQLTIRDAAKILGSEVQFVKITAQSTSHLRIFPVAILALSARGGVAERFGETRERKLPIPISERFFAGGRSTVRGYDQDLLGVPGKTIDLDSLKPTGGNAMVVFNEEIRFAFPASIGLVFFSDQGNVWLDVGDVRVDEIRSTVGTGIRYNTPVGPFRLDLGFKTDPERGEDRTALHFTLGHPF